MQIKQIFTYLSNPFKALAYPIFPIIPTCPTCAAMRFALLSALWTGWLIGLAMSDLSAGLSIGIISGVSWVISLYVVYKVGESGKDIP